MHSVFYLCTRLTYFVNSVLSNVLQFLETLFRINWGRSFCTPFINYHIVFFPFKLFTEETVLKMIHSFNDGHFLDCFLDLFISWFWYKLQSGYLFNCRNLLLVDHKCANSHEIKTRCWIFWIIFIFNAVPDLANIYNSQNEQLRCFGDN